MPTDPKKVLEALHAGTAEQLGFAADACAHAKALAEKPGTEGLQALPEPLLLAVLEASVRQKRADVTEALLTATSKEQLKAAKKAAYRLRSIGVEVREPKEPEAAPAPVASAPPEEEVPSVVSAFTGTGDRALIAVRPLRGGGLETVQAVINDEHGIVHLVLNEVSRGTWRRQLKELRSGRVPPSIEIPLRDATALLAHAAALNLESRTAFPANADLALRHLGVKAERHPVEIPAPEEGDARIAVDGHLLHQEPEIAGWLPPEGELRLLGERLQGITHSPIALTEQQKADQLIALVRSSAEAFFTPPVRKLYAGRLWAMAEFFERTGRAQPAMLAKAEARRLFHDAPGLFSRFGEGLYEKVLALMAHRAEEGAPAGGPPPTPPAPTSPGGIILP